MDMRDIIRIVEGTSTRGFSGVVYHGSDETFPAFDVDPKRGVYFSGDEAYARDYGSIIYTCRVTLEHPRVFTQEEADGNMEIDREVLIADGFDGRIVRYENGDLDVIAFYPEQIEILQQTEAESLTP